METDPVSETLCFYFVRTPNDGQGPETKLYQMRMLYSYRFERLSDHKRSQMGSLQSLRFSLQRDDNPTSSVLTRDVTP
jgi:hypothetical protein